MENQTVIQYFHWYNATSTLWSEVKDKAQYLQQLGITAAWLPPAYKAASGNISVGFDPYDLYDLGEFDQKGSIPTKYGNVAEYIDAVNTLKHHNIITIVDIVLNHKAGADEVEKMMAIKVNADDRTEQLEEPIEIEAFTKFNFNRNNQYSNFIWNSTCFSGVDFDSKKEETAIFKIINEYGTDWEDMISAEKGNYDYLMYCDIEFRNTAVIEELKKWGKWYHDKVGFGGVRLDAVKHISPQFFNEWLTFLKDNIEQNIFAVGEYWAPGNLDLLLKYIEATDGNMSLFDSCLQHNFHTASNSGNNFDLTTILDNCLTTALPEKSVTVVDNHDTQPLQALEANVQEWFKPLAYALILLRQNGLPCLFYPDLFGCTYHGIDKEGNEQTIIINKTEGIEALLHARKNNAYGTQIDYFNFTNCIGWVRQGNENYNGCAVLMSNSEAGTKVMEMGKNYANKTFADALGKCNNEVTINEDGFGEFTCAPGSVSVWVIK